MALKWQNHANDSGILRKNEIYESKEDLLVFGYSCKLFRDDEKAILIDQGKHLIPWMGDDSLKIDRYDCRGSMGAKELGAAESRVEHGSVNWHHHMSPEEQRAERLCDAERYRALHTDEDEEEMYREEELKRLHMAHNASYGQVEFNYEGDPGKKDAITQEEKDKLAEDDEPFVPTPELNIPDGMPLPDTKKLNAIVEKTAAFIASQGTQMEILLKAKQAGNRQFDFLSLECPLHRYYSLVLGAIREGRYRPDQQQKQQQEKIEEEEHYLHPSLAPVPVESAPSIPSIAYKPSANCAYSMLVNQIKGKTTEAEGDGSTEMDIAPPGTEILPLPIRPETTESTFSKMDIEQLKKYAAYPFQPAIVNQADISKAAVMYDKNTARDAVKVAVSTVAVVTAPSAVVEKEIVPYSSPFNSNTNSPRPEKFKSGGLKLIHYSDSEDNSDSSDSDESHSKSSIMIPPPDLQIIVDKMASYVAKNGDAFESIVKMKGDPRFFFLNPEHQYYGYYKHKRSFYEQSSKQIVSSAPDPDKGDPEKDTIKKETQAKAPGPVSFSIKKMKEPEPILPKPALQYESSSDEETTKETTESNDKTPPTTEELKPILIQPKQIIEIPVTINAPKISVPEPEPIPKPITVIMPIIVSKPISVSKPITIAKSSVLVAPKPVPPPQNNLVIRNEPNSSENVSMPPLPHFKSHKKSHRSEKTSSEKWYSLGGNEDKRDGLDRRKESKRKRSHSRKRSKRDRCDDVITINEDSEPVDPSDFIDLTDDIDDKDKNSDSGDKNKIQTDRKRRAAAFLSSLQGSGEPARHQSSLASAMAATLHTLQDCRGNSRRRRRDDRRKSKKSRRESKERHYSESGDEMDRSERSSRHHHGSRKHSKKSKKSCSKDERYQGSRSHKEEKKSRRHDRSPRAEENSELKTLEESFKICRNQDKLLTSSLKDLVKEARKELISKEPIKMALDIFSNDSSNERSLSSGVRNSQAHEDDWEKDNSEDESKDSSSNTASSIEGYD